MNQPSEHNSTGPDTETNEGQDNPPADNLASYWEQFPVLPSLVTLANAFFGLMAVGQIFKAFLSTMGYEEPVVPVFGRLFQMFPSSAPEHLTLAGWFILGGMVLDALDGKLARMTDSTSIFGIELDSLCDAVTFGVAPALLMYVAVYYLRIGESGAHPFLFTFSFPVAALYLFCVLIRLARFNVSKNPESDEHGAFYGLPSPAAAGFIAAGILLLLSLSGRLSPEAVPLEKAFQKMPVKTALQVLPWIVSVLAVAMISPIEYPHFFDEFTSSEYGVWKYLALAGGVVLLFLEPELTLFLVFLLYVTYGPLDAMHDRARKTADQNI